MLGREIKLNFSHFSPRHIEISGFGVKNNGFRPLPQCSYVGVYCYSVKVSVIVKTCNIQRISYLLWSEFLIITQTRFWKKSRIKLIYPIITTRYIFLASQKFPIHKSKFREICKKWDCPPFSYINILFILSILKSKFQHVLGKMVLDPNRLHIRL